jgi:anti-sigma regulatory factor (Ser/Thr protein kinase)
METQNISVKADIKSLDEVMAFTEKVVDGRSLRLQNQLSIAVEEIFVNIANYSYENHCSAGDAIITVVMDGDNFTITFKDCGVPYNPLLRDDPDIFSPLESREIGGLGIFMVKKLVDSLEYRYEDGMNILTIQKNMSEEKEALNSDCI